MPGCCLLLRQTLHLHLDAAEPWQVAIRDVNDAHRQNLEQHRAAQATRQDREVSVIAFVHAHPDDEALLTAGTMRALFERGHRVVLIMATNGSAGLTSTDMTLDLAERRTSELQHSAKVLGVAQVYWLGYSDSGLHGELIGNTWCDGDAEEQIAKLLSIFRQENPDVVVGYDRAGGYGHPDHVRVHSVVAEAAKRAGISTLLEATIDRQTISAVLDFFSPLIKLFRVTEVMSLADGYSARADIGYVIDVRRWSAPKRASMRAHASQAVGGDVPRTLSLLLKIPAPIFKRLFKREWYRVVWSQANPFDELPKMAL